MRVVKSAALVAAVLVLTTGQTALAHMPDDGNASPLDVASHDEQHGGQDGHLPAVQKNVAVLGKLDLFAGGERPGRVSDVAAFGDYAYLGAFYEPDCRDGGVYVVDISNAADPQQAGFIPVDPFTYVGEGVQVLDLQTAFFDGPVLIHNNENCVPLSGPTVAGPGGTSMWDVRDPKNPKPLALHFGDLDAPPAGVTNASLPHQSHSAFGWQQGERAYVVAVDNVESGRSDIDIFDITNPASPTLVVETGLSDFPHVTETPAPNGNNAFLHDMVVKKVGDRYLMLASYWDGGYLILDVTNLPAKPVLLRETDFGAVEPFAAQLGLPADWTPEGNGHQAEFNYKNNLFLGADEDFGPRRMSGTVTSGTYQGARFSATQGSNVPQVDEDNPVSGPTAYVGQACGAVPPATSPDQVAVTERGGCTFTIKAQSIQAAGYQAGIVFNDRATDPDCESHVYMLAVADIPFMFVSRSTGLKLLNHAFADPCQTFTPTVVTSTASVSLDAVFDGWGYLHLYDANTMQALDHWALPESLDATKASGYGDLSIHEVAMDPRRNRAYLSHYAGGFRVVQFSRESGIREIGAYVAPGGSNFWGVEVHYRPGTDEPIVLASDRDAGLWIFQYKPQH